MRADFDALTQSPSRAVGSPGYDAAVAYLEKRLRAIPGVDLKVHRFDVMVPVTHSATLALPGGASETVYPLWPAAVRLNATPAEGITGRLVYVGGASDAEIVPGKLKGQIAVVEATAGERWTAASYFGARAVLLLGSPDLTNTELQHHQLLLPANLPRAYLPPGPLADRLRKGEITAAATLNISADWEPRTATNFYALLIPPNAPKGAAGRPMVIAAPFDGTSLVPSLAPGASQAVQPAAALAMLRDYAAHPPGRPVMLFLSGADGLENVATRTMLMALADPPAAWAPELTDLAEKRKTAESILARLRALGGDPLMLRPDGPDRALADRLAQLVETDLAVGQDELFRLRVVSPSKLSDAERSRLAALDDRRGRLNAVRYAFKSDPATLTKPYEPAFGATAIVETPADKTLAIAATYLPRLAAKLGGSDGRPGLLQQYDARRRVLQTRIDLYRWLAGRLGIDPNPDERATDQRLIELMVGLDFSDRGVRVGPMFWGWAERTSQITGIQNFRDWLARTERAAGDQEPAAAWWAGVAPLVDLEPLNQTRTPLTFTAGPIPLPSELSAAWAVPGFSLVTLEDLRLRRDTPNDTPGRVNFEALLPQIRAAHELLRHAWADARFKGQSEYRRYRTSFEGQVVSPAPGKPVPDLPRDGFVATYGYSTDPNQRIPVPREVPYAIGLRRTEVLPTDADGTYRVEGIPTLNADRMLLAVRVYRLAPGTGAITAATDLAKGGGGIYADLYGEVNPLRSLVFDGEEITLTGLYDPRFLQKLGEVTLMDARRNAEPQQFDLALSDGVMAAVVEPGSRNYLLFRYGRVGNRLVLLNMPTAAEAGEAADVGGGLGRGYTAGQFADLPPLALATARDFARLDRLRLEQQRRAGVSSPLLDGLQASSEAQIDAAADALTSGKSAAAVMRPATGAWAGQARVYDAAQAMANDVIYAAIFLLLLSVPFAFCMERLLIGTPNVYGQIAGAGGIFSAMALALYAFHPAFKISASPLIIVLAFAILLMSGVVIGVIYSRFDSELKRIRSGRGTSQGASFARASVLSSAVMLGIANMRRRKFRTALTSLTVVLITFAVLCFTSSTRYLDTTSLPTGATAGHAGVMLRQRGYRPMPEQALSTLAATLPGVVPDVLPTVVQRWWVLNAWDTKDMIDLTAGGVAVDRRAPRVLSVRAALGLSPGESSLGGIAEVIGPEKFAALERGEADVVYLSRRSAGQLGVAEGGTVRLGGMDLRVAGVYDADAFDQRVRTLAGDPLAPLAYSSGQLDAGGRQLAESNAESLSLGGGDSAAELASSYQFLGGNEFVILPAATARRLSFATLRSVGMRLAGKPQVDAAAAELSRRFALALYAADAPGGAVRLVSAGQPTSISGGQVAIPLALGGLIIFNTMMGSIAERRREIHVYTSLGLAPLHVGALFVAEAMTYGLIGTVFGYVIGQGVGTLLLRLGWLGNVTLNYSGTSAMLTMGLILGVVLLSALVPARLASKIAAPSIDRTWTVPAAVNDVITAQLPFTINKTAADGALAYLAEFLDAHREGSIGKFSADDVKPVLINVGDSESGLCEAASGGAVHGLEATIWLTPFDLGVRQQLTLLIRPGEFPDIYEVVVMLHRRSGDDASWHRMNRPFLTELRRQFLQWRSLTRERMMEYVAESRGMFGGPVPSGAGPS